MNKTNLMTLLLTLCSVSSLIDAYENSFYNNTDEPIGIAIQYTGNGNNEPLYKLLVKPHSMNTFTPGNAEIPEIKWGFCLDNIYFIQNPTQEQKSHNFSKAQWKKIPITWTESASATKKKLKKGIDPKNIMVKVAKTEGKSLCRDRHFDITHDEHGKIIITSSLRE